MLIHPALTEQAEADGDGTRDFGPLFAGVKPVIEGADLAICHMEVPLATADGPFEGYPLFYAPPEVADAVAATGYDTCSTASNHTVDHGAEGVGRPSTRSTPRRSGTPGPRGRRRRPTRRW